MSDWNTSEGWSSGAQGALSGASTGFQYGGPIGAVAGGLVGGIAGLFGHKKKTDWNKKAYEESVRQFNVQDEYNKNRLQYTIKDAIKAGVNPVAAINSGSGHYSPTISAGGGSGSESGFDTQGFINGLNNFVLQKQARQDRAIALESANLDLESKRLENEILRQKLLTETQPGIVSQGTSNPKNRSWRIPMDYKLRDIEPGQLFLPWEDLHGDVYWFINPDAISDADYTNIEADRALAIGSKGVYRGVRKSWKRNSKKNTIDAVNSLW